MGTPDAGRSQFPRRLREDRMSIFIKFFSLLFISVLVTACSGPSTEAERPGDGASSGAPAAASSAADPERKYLLERVDDAAVVQLYADGFESLPLREKTLIWHLYQAAIAGRDIFIDQKHRDALEMRGILEQIVTHPDGIDSSVLS